ncbi:peptidoglycan-binding protein [Acrocarpospora corrugata]|uniref:Peptidoglycan-binding protein n=1 Tax=Acrocarpospora corrugata TaxID=35763 RepID=A0A5M3W8G4_9ACTN|nr:LysM peptidoglycan-binding domain-containing protein [Acrocarpospora corrugata]GES03473.1 peptidoglycan-binding protein [Acrocarpospora corrugata]
MALPGSDRPATRRAGSELAKATLIDTTTGTAHRVMYNPDELKFEQGNTFAEVGIPGLDTPPIQYIRGKARTLSMELFFDTYESGQDVRAFTGPIVALLDRRRQTMAPPVLLFSLGQVQLRCVLVEAGQRYTMFLRDGTPVRSTMSVRLQEYAEVAVEIRHGLFAGSPTVTAVADLAAAAVTGRDATVHLTVLGETLSSIAAAYLGDPGQWRRIADANRVLDPFDVPPGTRLVIPGGRP